MKEILGLGPSAYAHKSATVEELLQIARYATHGSPEQEENRAVLAMPERMIERLQKADDHGLSARQLELLILVSRGLSNRQIVSRLYLAESTVKRHFSNILTHILHPLTLTSIP